jgi:hypothetical protein
MSLPTADSIAAENHDHKPNGIPLDSVRPENALVQLAGDRQIARQLIKLLETRGAYAGG